MATNEKKVLSFEIDDDVKKITITGEDKDQQVVMRQELNEDDLVAVTGGAGAKKFVIVNTQQQYQRPTQQNPNGIAGGTIGG